MNAVTCVTWVRRGVAKAHPDLVRLAEDELQNLMSSAYGAAETESNSDEVDSSDEELRKKAKDNDSEKLKDSLEARYSLDDYDEDDDHESEKAGLSMAGLSFYASNRQDPHLSKDDQSSDEESELSISPDENLIALGKVHGEFFSLEVWVTNVTDGSLYCHHDTILSSCPLAIEWIGFDPGESDSSSSNLVAIGNMTPDIELWDLDVVNTLEPAFCLKGKWKHKRKKKALKKVETSRGHSDAVLALSWNKNRQQILGSASADTSVGVWDLSHGRVVSFLANHTDKVQAVQWHPVEDQLLVSGCYDGCVRLFDCRSADAGPGRQWSLGGEVEKVIWDHHDPFYLFAGTDGGSLCCVDVRCSTAVFNHEAHTSALSSLALSPSVPGCLLTASSDRSVNVWDVRGHLYPHLVRQRLCKIGEIHCAAVCPDEPLLFCVGGEFEMKLLNFCNDVNVTEKFDVSNKDFTDKTVSNPKNAGTTDSGPENPNTTVKSRKNKITRPDLSADSSNTVTKSCKANNIDNTVSKKKSSKSKSVVEPSQSGSKVKKSKHRKTNV